QARGLAGGAATRLDVRLGPGPGAVCARQVARILEAADGESAGGRLARRRLRSVGGRPRSLRTDRERAAHPPGDEIDQTIPEGLRWSGPPACHVGIRADIPDVA